MSLSFNSFVTDNHLSRRLHARAFVRDLRLLVRHVIFTFWQTDTQDSILIIKNAYFFGFFFIIPLISILSKLIVQVGILKIYKTLYHQYRNIFS